MVEHVIWPNLIVAQLFRDPWIGFGLAVGILLWATGIIVRNYFKHHRPISKALAERLEATQPVIDAETDADAQDAFASHYDEIDAAMMSGNKKLTELRHAWIEFGETFVDKNETPLRATTRPEGYFLHLGDDTRVLAWWANIFVALGLTFTFLGIIAALVGAVDAMGGGADMTRMQQALIGLLTITAAKFWTSIGGVVASIILRWVDRLWHSKVQRELEQLSERIERGTVFFPPQRFAAAQLRELEQQSVALTSFSHQLAASIGDALERNLQPVVSGLAGIQSSISEFRDGGFSEIGKNVASSINDHAGAQMAALAKALDEMTKILGSVNKGLDGASTQAAQQIAAAAAQFANASDEMLEAVRELVQTARTENGAAMNDALKDFAASMGEIRSAFDGMRKQISEMGEDLTKGSSNAADLNAKVLADAANALAAAAATAKDTMDDTLNTSIGKASDASARAMADAFAAFGTKFDTASGGLVAVLTSTSDQMSRYAGAIERSTGAASDHADKLADAGREAQAVSTMLGKAAADVSGAAGPIREATGTIRDTVAQSEDLLRRNGEATGHQLEAMTTISTRLDQVATTATQTWENYRTRFSEVDKSLGAALEQLRSMSTEHANELNTQTGRVDMALANAADRLGAALEPLDDLAGSLEDAVERLRTMPGFKE